MFFYLFFTWILCAVAASPIVAQFSPLLAKLHSRALELYTTLNRRQRISLHTGLSFLAYPAVSSAYTIGAYLLMPFIYTVLLTTGLLTFDKTQQFALATLEKVSPPLASFARIYTDQCLPEAQQSVARLLGAPQPDVNSHHPVLSATKSKQEEDCETTTKTRSRTPAY